MTRKDIYWDHGTESWEAWSYALDCEFWGNTQELARIARAEAEAKAAQDAAPSVEAEEPSIEELVARYKQTIRDEVASGKREQPNSFELAEAARTLALADDYDDETADAVFEFIREETRRFYATTGRRLGITESGASATPRTKPGKGNGVGNGRERRYHRPGDLA